jgi:hypothetical protein
MVRGNLVLDYVTFGDGASEFGRDRPGAVPHISSIPRLHMAVRHANAWMRTAHAAAATLRGNFLAAGRRVNRASMMDAPSWRFCVAPMLDGTGSSGFPSDRRWLARAKIDVL